MNKRKRNEAAGRLLAAQADFLRGLGWIPFAPTVPGGDVLWSRSGFTRLTTQAAASLELDRVLRGYYDDEDEE